MGAGAAVRHGRFVNGACGATNRSTRPGRVCVGTAVVAAGREPGGSGIAPRCKYMARVFVAEAREDVELSKRVRPRTESGAGARPGRVQQECTPGVPAPVAAIGTEVPNPQEPRTIERN